jgi:methyltransferase family protein
MERLPVVDDWLAALEHRYLSSLTLSETARALRALSSCYVERRGRIARGGALDSAGKRAAFALFYAPIHFEVTRNVLRCLNASSRVTSIVDLGCGTGVAGAAWALEANDPNVTGIDLHPWALSEARWTYSHLAVRGRTVRAAVDPRRVRGSPALAIVAGWSINELDPAVRPPLLARFMDAHERGAQVLVLEPIARRPLPWWTDWSRRAIGGGGRADEWRFPARLPPAARQLAVAAGLHPRDLTARSLFLPGRSPGRFE